MQLAHDIVSGLDRLVSLPDFYYKARQAMDDPDLSINDFAKLLGQDPALTAALLRQANSAFYGFPERINSLARAVSLMGLDQAGELVLSHAVTQAFSGIKPQRMDMQRFWRSSTRRAMLVRELAVMQGGKRDAERLFVLGLLSDLGHLALYCAQPDLMGIVLDMPSSSLSEEARNEQQIIGCDFTEVGAALASHWHLPPSLAQAIGAQLSPTDAGENQRDAALLNIAGAISYAQENLANASEQPLDLHPASLDIVGVSLPAVVDCAVKIEAELGHHLQELGLGKR